MPIVLFCVCVLSYYLSLCSEFSVVMSVIVKIHKYNVRFVFTSSCCRKIRVLFTLFVHSGVQHVLLFCFLSCVPYVTSFSGLFLFFFVLCTVYYQFLWIVHFWLALLYSLTFIYILLIGVDGWGIRIVNWMLLIIHTLSTQKYTYWTEVIKHSTTIIR